MIVCNINQIRSSLFRGLGVNETDIDLLYKQFYTGMDRNLTPREQKVILDIATSEVKNATATYEKLDDIPYTKKVWDAQKD